MKMDKMTQTDSFVKHTFDSLKNYIVVGLCGKTGAGCSTAAQILNTDYSELHMEKYEPRNSSFETLYTQREYKIMQQYAEKHWEPFEIIKVSALITARVLENCPEKLAGLLSDIAQYQAEYDNKYDYGEICQSFFRKAMYINLSAYTEKKENCFWCPEVRELLSVTDICKAERFSRLATQQFFSDMQSSRKIHPDDAEFTCSFQCEVNGVNVTFVPDTSWIRITNRDLYHLFSYFCRCHKDKTSLDNPIIFFILKEYIYHYLPEWCTSLWNHVDRICNISTIAMQMLGVHLRMFREPYYLKHTQLKTGGYTIIAEDINSSIKLLRKYHHFIHVILDKMVHTLIAVDSIKNPFESRYLSDRYSNYFLFGIYTEEDERRSRYHQFGKNIDNLTSLDIIEQHWELKKELHSCSAQVKNTKLSGKKYILEKLCDYVEKYAEIKNQISFFIQNVSICMENSDIFISNIIDDEKFYSLKTDLIRYVCLIMHPGLLLPTDIERNMQIAYTAKLNSGCLSRQVGAVVTDVQYHPLSIGWNRQPEGQFPCSYRDVSTICTSDSDDGTCKLMYSDYELDGEFKSILKQIYQSYKKNGFHTQEGLPFHYCFKDIYNSMTGEVNFNYSRSLHAEETAFFNLRGNVNAAIGGYLFTTSSPCVICSKMAMQMKISKIFYIEPYPGIQFKQVLSTGDSKMRPKLILFTGAIGKAYMKLYTPIMPLKDEDELRMGKQMTMLTEAGQEVDGEYILNNNINMTNDSPIPGRQ